MFTRITLQANIRTRLFCSSCDHLWDFIFGLYFDILICILNLQGSLIIRPSKKKPLVLRMVVLVFAMASGIYICSICLRQMGWQSSGRSVSIRVVERPCETTDIEPWEKPYVHFPKPKTFSR